MKLSQVEKKISKELKYLREHFHVQAIFIFGSVASNKANKKSDVDILVDFSNPNITFFEFLELQDYLQEMLGSKVDLVTRDALKSWMKEDVERQAVRVA